MVVWTAAQTSAFFTGADQMGLPADTYAQIQSEGIITVEDLSEFDDDSFKQIADNLRRPSGHIPDPPPGAAAGSTIPTPPFVFGAKSQQRLQAAATLVRY